MEKTGAELSSDRTEDASHHELEIPALRVTDKNRVIGGLAHVVDDLQADPGTLCGLRERVAKRFR
jgi:hypothetical protein